MVITSSHSPIWLEIFIQLINLAILLAITICIIYGFVLFVKLARRGIKALDIFIQKNK